MTSHLGSTRYKWTRFGDLNDAVDMWRFTSEEWHSRMPKVMLDAYLHRVDPETRLNKEIGQSAKTWEHLTAVEVTELLVAMGSPEYPRNACEKLVADKGSLTILLSMGFSPNEVIPSRKVSVLTRLFRQRNGLEEEEQTTNVLPNLGRGVKTGPRMVNGVDVSSVLALTGSQARLNALEDAPAPVVGHSMFSKRGSLPPPMAVEDNAFSTTTTTASSSSTEASNNSAIAIPLMPPDADRFPAPKRQVMKKRNQ